MRLFQYQYLILPSLVLLLLSCDQDIISAGDQPRIAYILAVTDSASTAPLGAVRIRVTTITGDTATYLTDSSDGRVELPSLYSSRTSFVFQLSGYRTLDLVDSASSIFDTLSNRPLTKLLQVRMVKLKSVLDLDSLSRDALKDTFAFHFRDQPLGQRHLRSSVGFD